MKRHGKANIEQRNWRSWKRGKEWVFGCSLFLSLGATSLLLAPTTAHAEQQIVDSDDKRTEIETSDAALADNEEQVESANEASLLQAVTEYAGQSSQEGNDQRVEMNILPVNESLEKETPSTEEDSITDSITPSAEVDNIENQTNTTDDVTSNTNSVFRRATNSSPTSTHSTDGLRITKGLYDIEFTNAGELASRAGKGDIGFVKLNDYTAAYLFNFGDKDSISLEELRERIVLRPKDGGKLVYGSATSNYRIVTEGGTKYFKDSRNRVEALYIVSVMNGINNNPNYSQQVIGTRADGDGGDGRYNTLVPLNIKSGSSIITEPQEYMVTSGGYYSYSLHYGDRIVPGNTSHSTSMNFFLIAVDTKRPVVNEEVTRGNFERALGDSQLNKDNIDSVMTLSNVEVTDNVLRKAKLQTAEYTNIHLRDEQGNEHTVAGLKELLNGPNAADYGNKNYTVIIKTSDLPNAEGVSVVSSEQIVVGIVDKNPLQEAQNHANTVSTNANTQNQSPDSIDAYNAAVANFNNAQQQAQAVLDKPKATVEEILNAISTLKAREQQVIEKAAQLTPSQAYTHQVEGGRLVKYVTESVTEEELKQTVTNLPNGANITLSQAFVNPNAVGEHRFNATITYADRSTKEIQLTLVQNKDPRALQSALNQLIADIDRVVATENKAPNTVVEYNTQLESARALRDNAQRLLQELEQQNTTQEVLNTMTANVETGIRELTVKREAITDSMAFLNPISQSFTLERKMHDVIQEADLVAVATGLQGNPVVSLDEPFVKPSSEGTYPFAATARYSDGSTNAVTINLNLVTDWTQFNEIFSKLNTEMNVQVVRENKNPAAVAAYDEALKRAETVYNQLQGLQQLGSVNQATLDGTLFFLQQQVNELIDDLKGKRQQITPSLASQNPVAQPAPIIRSIKNPASEAEILAAVTLPEHAERVEFAPNTNRQWNNTQTYNVAIDVIYADTSVNRVIVEYTLTKDWTVLEEAANSANDQVQELESNTELLVDKRPSTVNAYRQALQHAKNQIQTAMTALQSKNPNTAQPTIDYYENQVKQAIARLNERVQQLEPSDASVYTPTTEKVVRTTKTLANAKALEAAVSNYPETAIVALVDPYNIPTTKGTHTVQAKVYYKDQTQDTVVITYIINLDFKSFNHLKSQLEEAIAYGHGDANLDEKTKASVENYRAKLAAAISVKEQADELIANQDTEQTQLDRFENSLGAALADLRNAANYYLVDSEATKYTPGTQRLVRDTNTLATAEEIARNVYVHGTYGYTLSLSPGQEVPNSEGVYKVRVTITYKDESSEEVEVDYTVNTYKRRLQQATYNLNNLLQSNPVLSDKSPDTVEAYEQALANAQQIIQETQAIEQASDSSQKSIDEAERKVTEAIDALTKARDGLQRSQAAIHTPRMERLEKTMRETIELSDIREHLKDIPEDATITTNQEVVKREGANAVSLTIHYADRSTEDINVYYYYTTVKTDLTAIMDTLRQQIDERPVTSDMRPSTIEAYNNVLREAERLHHQEINTLINDLPQTEIDAATERIRKISEQLQEVRDALAIKDSVTYPVQNGILTTTIKRLATDEQLIATLGELPGGATAEIKRTYSKYVGIHYVEITLTYPDNSTNSVHVEYHITLHKEDLDKANSALEAVINQEVDLENVSPKAIQAYQEAKKAQQNELGYGRYIHDNGNQDQIDLTVTRMETARENMLEAIRGLVPSEAFTTTPTNGALTRTVKQTVTQQELLQTIGGIPETARVELAPNTIIPRDEVKTHILNATVTYQDGSIDQVEIHLTLTTDLTALNRQKTALEAELATEALTEGKRPSTVEAYQEARVQAQEKLAVAQQLAQDPSATQTDIDRATQEATQAMERLKATAANIVDSDATRYQPSVAELTRTMKNLALENDVFQQITIQGATFTTALASAMALPNSVGKHKVRVQILYGDRSREEVDVPYTITVDTAELAQKNTQLQVALQQLVDTMDKTQASIERYEAEKSRIEVLLATARNIEQTEVQDQQRIDDEVTQVNRALQDLQAAINQLTDTQAKLINPETTQYRTDAQNLATVNQLTQAVTIPNVSGYQVTLPNYTDATLPTEIGTYVLMATLLYQDASSEQVKIEYTITPYQDELSAANTQLMNKLSEAVITDQKRPVTIRNYEQALANARQVQEQTQRMLTEIATNSGPARQALIDEQARLATEAHMRLVEAISGLEDSDAKTYTPVAQPLVRTLKNLASAQDLVRQVTGQPQDAIVSIVESTLPQQVGEHRVVATVNYNDETSETVEILYIITTDKEALSQAIAALTQTDRMPIELTGIRPSDIERYQNAKQQATTKLAEARELFEDAGALQADIDAMVEAVNDVQAILQQAQTNLNPSEATLYTPAVNAITRTVRDLATIEQVKASVTVSETQGYQVTLDEAELPRTIGKHQISATVVYADRSIEKITIPYTITTDKAPLATANDALMHDLDSVSPADTKDMSPVTIAAFEQAQEEARALLKEARQLHDTVTDDQDALDQMVERLAQAQAKVAETKAALRQAQAISVQLVINPLVVTVKNLANQDALKARVTNAPDDARVVLTNEQLPTDEGIHEISAIVYYADQSTKPITIRYEITSDKTELTAALGQLNNEKDQLATTEGMKPQTIEDYRAAQEQAATVFEQAQATLNNPNSKQTDLDAAQRQVEAATQRLQEAKQALVPSLATLTQLQERELTRTVTNPANQAEIIHLISSQSLPEGTQFELQNADNIPTDLGTHSLAVKVTYNDRSEEMVTVRYTVTTDTSGLDEAKQILADELAKPVDTEGKRQSTVDALEVARRNALAEVISAQDILKVAGPTQADIDAAIRKVNEQLAQYRQAVANLEDSYATLQTPTDGLLERTIKNLATLEEIVATVTVSEGLQQVVLAPNVTIPSTVGRHELDVLVTYTDQSHETAKVVYTITTHKADLAGANQVLNAQITQIPVTEGKRQSTIEQYNQAKQAAETILAEAQAILSNSDAEQTVIDEVLLRVTQAQQDLTDAINAIVDADATTHTPTNGTLVVKATQLATKEQLESTITVDGAGAIQVLLDNETPPTEVGVHRLEAIVIYADGSSEKAYVDYTIVLDTDALQATQNKLQQKLAEYVKETDRSQATLNQYQLAKRAAESAMALSEQFLAEEAATAKQPAADNLERQLENAYTELVNAIAGLRDSQASINQPTIAQLTRTLKEAFEPQHLLNRVTDLPPGARVVINEPDVIPTNVGHYQISATIFYEDLSTKAIEIPYEITTYTDELQEAKHQLQEVVKITPVTDEKSPVAVRRYQELLVQAQQKLAEVSAYLDDQATPQSTLNDATNGLQQLKQQIEEAMRQIVDSQAKLNEPRATDLSTKVTAPVTVEQLTQQVATLPSANVQLLLPNGMVPTTVGRHEIPVQVTYEDESVDNTVLVLVIEVDPAALNEANTNLNAFLAQPVDIAMKSPDTLAVYQEALRIAQETLRNSQHIATTEVANQTTLDEAKNATEQAMIRLQEAINQLTPSEASQYTPVSDGLTRTMRQQADSNALVETIKGQPSNARIQIVGVIPTIEGEHQIEALVTYHDRSTDTVLIPYTLYADKTDLTTALAQLVEQLQKESDTNNKKPDTIDAYHQAKAIAQQALVAGTALSGELNPAQVTVDETTMTLRNALRDLQAAIKGLVPSQASTTSLTDGQLQRHVNNKATAAELKAPIGKLPEGATATIQEVPQTVGRHDVVVSVVFEDRSTKRFTVNYEIVLDKEPLMQVNDILAQIIASEAILNDKSPATARAYRDAKVNAEQVLEATRAVYATEVVDQANVDAAITRAHQATEQLQQALRNLTVSQAAQNTPTGQTVERTMRTLASETELAQAIDGKPVDAVVELLVEVPRVEGAHTIPARLTYADQSTDDVTITYIVQTVKTDLDTAIESLIRQINENVEIVGKRPATVSEYERMKQVADQLVAQANIILSNTTTKQTTLDSTTELINQMRKQLADAIANITDSDATVYQPDNVEIKRTVKQLASTQDLIDTIQVPDTVPNVTITLETMALPTEVGIHEVHAIVTYPDTTQDIVTIRYIIETDKQVLQQANHQLLTTLTEPLDLADMSPLTVAVYQKALDAAEAAQRAAMAILEDGNRYGDQANIDARAQEVVDAQQALEAAIKQLKKAESFLHNPSADNMTRTLKSLATPEELSALVKDIPATATIELENPETFPETVGEHQVAFLIRYADATEERIHVQYTIQTYKDELEITFDTLKKLVDKDTDILDKAPLTVNRYHESIKAATAQLVAARTILDDVQAEQVAINEAAQLVAQAETRLQEAIKALVDSQAKTNQPHIEQISRPVRHLATPDEIITQITGLPETAKVKVDESTLPNTIGKHQVKIHVQYEDLSTKELVVEYVVTSDKGKLTEVENSLQKQLVKAMDIFSQYPGITSKFEVIQHNAQQQLVQAQYILSDPNATQEAIDNAEATLTMIEAQLQLLMIDAQSDAPSTPQVEPSESSECPTCIATSEQKLSEAVTRKQLPATGEADTNLLLYTMAALTGFAGVVLGRKKKEDEEA